MKMERSKALQVCKAVGLSTADRWENTRMAAKMESIPEMKGIDGVRKGIKDKETRNLLDAVLTVFEEGKSVTVVDDVNVDDVKPAKAEAPAKNGKAAPAKAKAKAAAQEDDDEPEDEEEDEDYGDEDEEGDLDAEDEDEDTEGDEEAEEEDDEEDEPAPKKSKGKPAPKKSKGKPKAAAKPSKNGKAKVGRPPSKKPKAPVEKDVYGNRKSTPLTRTNRINQAIYDAGAKGITVKEIEKKAKAHSIHSHLYKLRNLGFVKSADGRYYHKKSVKAGK